MNCYGSVERLGTMVGEAPGAALLEALCAASRMAEGPYGAGRVFWTGARAVVVDGLRSSGYGAWPPGGNLLPLGDCLGVTRVQEDTGGSGVWSWAEEVALSGVALEPQGDAWPKTGLARLGSYGSVATRLGWAHGHRRYRVTGVFGFGDGSPWPWRRVAALGTLDASGTALALGAGGGVAMGQTLLVGSAGPGTAEGTADPAGTASGMSGCEQVFVESVASDGLSAVVRRGVNGSTAKAAAGAALWAAAWPEDLSKAVEWLAAADWKAATRAGLSEVQIGEYRERIMAEGMQARVLQRVFGRLRG